MLNWIKDKMKHIISDLKKAHRSITIWFNSVIASIFFLVPDAIAYFPQLQEYIPAPTYKTGMMILLVGNFMLRFKTTKSLRDK